MGKIYTKTGDEGLTSLYGGQRVPKYQPRVEVFGSLDELNANIGLALTEVRDEKLRERLRMIQNILFNVGAEAAEGGTKARRMIDDALRVNPMRVADLERWIDDYESELPRLTGFILPGGSPAGARLHLARAVCRRAERKLAHLNELEEVNPASLMYLNRLSDFLFVAARFANAQANATEHNWEKPSSPDQSE
jgi:cob(I)alamin adenosyltransferase